MDKQLGEKHVIVMAGFTVAAVVAASAYGFKRVLRKCGKKQSVSSASMESLVDFEERQIKENEFSDFGTQIDEDNHVETSATNSLPISIPPYGTTDRDIETHDDDSVDKGKDNKEMEMEMEKLNACMKELQGKMAKLDSQESDINQLKRKVKEDEAKLEKVDLQEVEINELKMKIREDENKISEMQKELTMLREKKNKKKGNWWNRGSEVHDVAVSEFATTKKLQYK